MISLPYYNKNDVDILPTNDVLKSDDWMYVRNGCAPLCFAVKDRVWFSFDVWVNSGNYDVMITCGDFKLRIKPWADKQISGSYEGDLPGDYRDYGNGHTFQIVLVQQDDGLHFTGYVNDYSFSAVYPDKKIGNLILEFRSSAYIRNIFCQEKDTLPTYAVNEVLTEDSIDNWEINDNSEYVLTNVDTEGIVHINQEVLDKLLADNDILACMISMEVEKKGDKLKYMEFCVGDVKKSVEIPHGKSLVTIGLEFSKPSELKNMVLTVKG